MMSILGHEALRLAEREALHLAEHVALQYAEHEATELWDRATGTS